MLTMVLVFFYCMGEAVREICFKHAADTAKTAANFALALARQPWIWIGSFIWFLESLLWISTLSQAPLSVAFPMSNFLYVLVPLLGAAFFKERLGWRRLLGAGLVTAGVICVGFSQL